jgi:hypothetical protein
MQDGTLLLGPILFQDFEVPTNILWGGRQRLAVHDLPGGVRVIDALGRDDTPVVWSGVFTGEDAAARARVLDTMRAAGGVWPLTWGTFFYSVVISGFVANYNRSNWIPYTIACSVLRDEASAVLVASLDLATTALADLASATSFGTSVDLTAATSALGQPGATTVGTQAYGAAMASLSGSAASIGAGVTTAGNALAGATDPGVAADTAGSLAGLTSASGYVQRALANLAGASS